MLDFYASMFTNSGLPPTSYKQAVSDALVESLVTRGNEATVAARFTELLATGMYEAMMFLMSIAGSGDDDEQARLAHLIGRLKGCE